VTEKYTVEGIDGRVDFDGATATTFTDQGSRTFPSSEVSSVEWTAATESSRGCLSIFCSNENAPIRIAFTAPQQPRMEWLFRNLDPESAAGALAVDPGGAQNKAEPPPRLNNVIGRYYDATGRSIGFAEALKFQLRDQVGYAAAQRDGKAAAQRAKIAAKHGLSAREIENSVVPFGHYVIYLSDDGDVVWPEGRGALDGARAVVETSGTKSIASRSTATRKILAPYLGQKKLASDTRRCFLVIEGRGWSKTVDVDVDREDAARAFAAKINSRSGVASATEVEPSPMDITEEISKLAALRDRGILTEDEFATKKTELLSRL